ncbi:MAG: hypothetical protein IJ085_08530 [Turicibacter sp.]|nr:hypothetical protein [Turicibacter sp.]MBQ8994141.1 hypothetical protein [Turicibacter sp.]
MSFQEYLAMWDQVYVWCDGEREKFIEGAQQYASKYGLTLEELELEREPYED